MIHKCKITIIRNTTTSLRHEFHYLPTSIYFIALALFLLSGCQAPQENYPRIDYASVNTGYDIPPVVTPPVWTPPKVDNSSGVPGDWIPISSERNWSAIIIHHSATETGNMALFDKEHKSYGWDGVGYDFVIGNGTDSGDGQVEVTFRWKQQLTGAHCKTPDNWANEYGIGICLVGNFNDRSPTQRQMQAFLRLTDFLQRRYGIPQSKITGHGETRGAHATDCPGNIFPMSRFKSMLSF